MSSAECAKRANRDAENAEEEKKNWPKGPKICTRRGPEGDPRVQPETGSGKNAEGLKNRELDKEAAQIFWPERGTVF
jgi:hypothetical protein